jgi:hypothetical protein
VKPTAYFGRLADLKSRTGGNAQAAYASRGELSHGDAHALRYSQGAGYLFNGVLDPIQHLEE